MGNGLIAIEQNCFHITANTLKGTYVIIIHNDFREGKEQSIGTSYSKFKTRPIVQKGAVTLTRKPEENKSGQVFATLLSYFPSFKKLFPQVVVLTQRQPSRSRTTLFAPVLFHTPCLFSILSPQRKRLP